MQRPNAGIGPIDGAAIRTWTLGHTQAYTDARDGTDEGRGGGDGNMES